MFRDYDSNPKVERRVLRWGVSLDDLIAHAITQRWVALGKRGPTETQPLNYVWRTGGGDADVFNVVNIDLGMSYLEVLSADAGVIAGEMAAIEADPRVPVFSDAEVFALSEAARERGDKNSAVCLVSLSSPSSFDPAWMPLYERAAQDDDAEVRRASLFAMGQAGWPEFRPLIERLAGADPDERVRSTAVNLQGVFDGKFGAHAPAAA